MNDGRGPPVLVVLAGLPGTGKTTFAKAVAGRLRAVHLRIDAIEQAILAAGVAKRDLGAGGYRAGYALAAENLEIGHDVVADAVNAVRTAREGWRKVASQTGSRLVEIEVICSDRSEHRRRVEERHALAKGTGVPSWSEVERRRFDPHEGPAITIDTAAETVDSAAMRVIDLITVDRQSG